MEGGYALYLVPTLGYMRSPTGICPLRQGQNGRSSSGVERVIGNDEVGSSILPCGTIFFCAIAAASLGFERVNFSCAIAQKMVSGADLIDRSAQNFHSIM
jgi:hypothetical protein